MDVVMDGKISLQKSGKRRLNVPSGFKHNCKNTYIKHSRYVQVKNHNTIMI